MKYFEIEGKTVRALPFDKELRGDNKAKIMTHNVFYKLPKGSDDSAMTYKAIHEKFEKYGKIKSTKMSLNPDHSKRGFAFICFEDESSTQKCVEDLGQSG